MPQQPGVLRRWLLRRGAHLLPEMAGAARHLHLSACTAGFALAESEAFPYICWRTEGRLYDSQSAYSPVEGCTDCFHTLGPCLTQSLLENTRLTAAGVRRTE